MPLYYIFKAVWKIAWRLIKKYGLVALIIIYLCRPWLFSGMVTKFLEAKIQEKTGLVVGIERFGGSYFGSVSLHNIQLKKPSEILPQAKIKQICVSYNILGPLFGERILQSIVVENPEISLSIQSEPESNRENPKKSPGMKLLQEILDSVDFGVIVSNAPNIKLSEVQFSCQMPKQKIRIQNFSLSTSPQGGKASVDKIVLEGIGESNLAKSEDGTKPTKSEDGTKPAKPEDGTKPAKPEDGTKPAKPEDGTKPEKPQSPETDKIKEDVGTSEISDISLVWSFQKPVLKVERFQARVLGQAVAFSVKNPLQIDLTRQKIRLEKFDIPLPNESHFRGEISPDDGIFLELQNFSLDFVEILPLCEIVYGKIKPCSMGFNTGFSLEIPQWDIARMKGKFDLAVYKPPRKKDEPPVLAKQSGNSGFMFCIRIEDISSLDELMESLGQPALKANIAGKLGIDGSLRQEGTKNTEISDKNEPPKPEDKKDTKFLDFDDSTIVCCDGHLQADGLKISMLREFLKTLDASVDWKISSDLLARKVAFSDVRARINSAQVNLSGEVKRTPRLDGFTKGEAILPSLYSVLPESILPEPIRNRVDASFTTGWEIQASLESENPSEPARPDTSEAHPSEPQKPHKPNDGIPTNEPADTKKIASSDKATLFPLAVSGKHWLAIKTLQIMGKMVEDIAFASEFSMKDERLFLSSLTGKWQKKEFLQASAEGGIKPGSRCAARMSLNLESVEEIAKKYLDMDIPFRCGRLHVALQCDGVLPEPGKPWALDAKIDGDLKRGQIYDIQYASIAFSAHLQITQEAVFLQDVRLSFENEEILALKGCIYYKTTQKSTLECKVNLSSLESKLGNILTLPANLQPPKKVEIDARLGFVLPELVSNISNMFQSSDQAMPLESKIRILLHKMRYEDFALDTLALDSQFQAGVNKVELSSFSLKVDDGASLSCQGSLERKGASFPDMLILPHIQGRFSIPKVSDVSPAKNLYDLDGKMSARFSLEGQIPLDFRDKSPLRLESQVSLRFKEGKIAKFACENAKLGLLLLVDSRNVECKNFRLSYGGKEILQSEARLDYRTGKSSLQCAFSVPSLMQYIGPLIENPSLRQQIAIGNVKGTVDIKAQLPLQGKSLRAGGNVRVELDDCSFSGKQYGKFTLDTRFQSDRKTCTLHFLNLGDGKNTLAKLQGNLAIQPGERSRIECQIACPRLERYLPEQLASKVACTSDLQGHWTLEGVLPGLQPNFHLALKSQIALENGTLSMPGSAMPPISWKKIALSTGLEASDDKVTLHKIACEYDTVPILEAHGNFDFQGSEQIECMARMELGNILKKIVAEWPQFQFDGDTHVQVKAKGILSLARKWADIETSLELPILPAGQDREWKAEAGVISLSGRKGAKSPFKASMPLSGNSRTVSQAGSQAIPNANLQAIHNANLQAVSSDGIHLQGRIRGQWDSPAIEGDLKFFLRMLKFIPQDMSARDIAIETRFQKDKVIFRSSVLLGGSPIQCEGEIAYKNWMPQSLEVRVQGKRILIIRNDLVYSRADMNLSLGGEVKFPQNAMPKFVGKLAGQIDMNELNVNFSIPLEGQGERVSSLPNLEFPFLDLRLDLTLNFPKIVINNNLVKIETTGKLDVGGSLADLQVKGYFTTNSGKLYLPQGVMNIKECIIRFKPEELLAPYLDVKAETTVRNYQIFAVVQGRLGDFLIEFYSVPPLRKEDVLLLLLTGATQSELSDSASEKLKETGSFILLQQVLNRVGIGDYVSAQVTEKSAAITITPPQWKGFALQGKVTQQGDMRFNVIYRLEFK